MEHAQPVDQDRCISCGAPIPEGRMICFCCENGTDPVEETIKMQEEKKNESTCG